MEDFFKKIKVPGKMLLLFLGIILLISIFNYFGLISSSVIVILDMLVLACFIFMIGFHFGKKREKQGFVAGIISGFISIGILFLLNLIFVRVRFNPAMLVYYGVLVLTSIMGSMWGINKK